MATIITVDDPGDPRVDDYRDLTAADRRPDRPGGRGLVIAEGVVVVRRMVESPFPVRSLLGVRRRIDELADDLAGLDVPAYAADATTMAEVWASISTEVCSRWRIVPRRPTRPRWYVTPAWSPCSKA